MAKQNLRKVEWDARCSKDPHLHYGRICISAVPMSCSVILVTWRRSGRSSRLQKLPHADCGAPARVPRQQTAIRACRRWTRSPGAGARRARERSPHRPRRRTMTPMAMKGRHLDVPPSHDRDREGKARRREKRLPASRSFSDLDGGSGEWRSKSPVHRTVKRSSCRRWPSVLLLRLATARHLRRPAGCRCENLPLCWREPSTSRPVAACLRGTSDARWRHRSTI